MNKPSKNNRLSSAWHPSHEELLCYGDGELQAEEAARVRAHLEACWSCRVRSEKLQETIAAFIDYRTRVLDPLFQPPNQWRTFRTRLRRVVEESGRRPLLTAWRDLLAEYFQTVRLPLALTSGLCLVLLIAVLFTQLSKVPVASASELLSRSAEIRTAQIQAVPRPIVYQRLHVLRSLVAASNTPSEEQSATVEVWSNPLGAEVRVVGQGWAEVSAASPNTQTRSSSRGKAQAEVRGAFAVWKELEQTCRANRLEWSQPLSATSYGAWRARLSDKDERVEDSTLPNGAKALKLWTIAKGVVPIGGIAEAGLVLRVSDLHPIEGTFGVRAKDGDYHYKLAEMNFRVVSFETLGPNIFAEPPLVATAGPRAVSAPPVIPPSISSAELAAAEMEVRVALHRVAADLGEPIEIVRAPREVEVRGLVDTGNRKKELLGALQGIPHLVTQILTVAEASNASPPSAAGGPLQERSPSAAAGPASAASAVISPTLPVQDQLEKYFSEHRAAAASQSGGQSSSTLAESIQRDIQRLSIQATTISEGALEHAWALRRLAERYPQGEVATLNQKSRRQLESLVRDHVRALSEQYRMYNALVKPVLLSIAGTEESSSEGGTGLTEASWPAFSPSLFNTVSQVDRLTSTLFAGAALPEEADYDPAGQMRVRKKTPEACVRDFLAALSLLDNELPRLEKQTQGNFLSNR